MLKFLFVTHWFLNCQTHCLVMVYQMKYKENTKMLSSQQEINISCISCQNCKHKINSVFCCWFLFVFLFMFVIYTFNMFAWGLYWGKRGRVCANCRRNCQNLCIYAIYQCSLNPRKVLWWCPVLPVFKHVYLHKLFFTMCQIGTKLLLCLFWRGHMCPNKQISQ